MCEGLAWWLRDVCTAGSLRRRYRRRFCDKIYAEVNYHRNDSANLACLLLLLSRQIM